VIQYSHPEAFVKFKPSCGYDSCSSSTRVALINEDGTWVEIFRGRDFSEEDLKKRMARRREEFDEFVQPYLDPDRMIPQKIGGSIDRVVNRGILDVSLTDFLTDLANFLEALRKAPEHWKSKSLPPSRESEIASVLIPAIDGLLKVIQDAR